MQRITGGLVAAAALAWSPAALAMHWCGVPAIVPAEFDDFDRIVPNVERLTGCAAQASTSAHHAEWVCPDDPETDAVEMVQIMLVRTPGENANLLITATGVDTLDMLRACRNARLRDGKRFEPGNVALRDQMVLDAIGPALTLANTGPGTISFVYTGPRFGLDSAWEAGVVEGGFGIELVPFPTTKVKLGGVSPIDTPAQALVAAFQARGSRLVSGEDLETALPIWTLTPPIGLAGVRQVQVHGYIRHVLSAEYVLSTTPDYDRFVGLLDAEYGASAGKMVKRCTHRWWFSGQVSIRGRHCPEGDTIEFTNDVASRQLVQAVDKRKADQLAAPDPKKPVIDPDTL